MRKMLISSILSFLGLIFVLSPAQGDNQSGYLPPALTTSSDPTVMAKLDGLTSRLEELKSETLENRKALDEIRGEINIGKGMMIAVGAMGLMTFINMILSLVGCRTIRK